ncbi:MAG TPA: lipocalin family protein [Spirochaetota bacterium]
MKSFFFCAVMVLFGGSMVFAGGPGDKFLGNWNMVRIVDGEHQMDLPPDNPELFATWEFRNDGTGQIVMGKDGEKKDIEFSWSYEDGGLRISGSVDGTTDIVTATLDDDDSTLTLSKSETDTVVLVRKKEK